MRKIKKHTITVTVLTPEQDTLDHFISMADIVREYEDGEFIGDFKITKVEEIEGKENIERELHAIGNDGSFFEFDEEDDA